MAGLDPLTGRLSETPPFFTTGRLATGGVYYDAAMCGKQQRRLLSDYLRLLEEFVDQRLSATDFERTYLRMFKEDPTFRPSREYEILNAVFAAADAFCGDPSIAGTGALDEDGLRAEAKAALDALRLLSGSQA